jgi:hypothetical protein
MPIRRLEFEEIMKVMKGIEYYSYLQDKFNHTKETN